jgi:hypothetical protein
MAKGVLFVMTQPVDSQSEEAYNDWYDNVHLADALKLAGYTAARRYKPVPDPEGVPPADGISWWGYVALYEVEADDLQAAYANLLEAVGRGDLPMSPTISLDPSPIMKMFEQITEFRG